MTRKEDTTVLVTGGSGFLGAHCVAALLREGYRVRTTVRSLDRERDVRAMVAAAGVDDGRLSFAAADLTADDGWHDAVAGCDYVLHVASPFPPAQPEDEDELVVPAREGTVRVLRAAHAAGVRRVVLTSSFAAIGYGHRERKGSGRVFTEADWSDPAGPGVYPYVKSKILAERAAWDFARDSGLELAVVNPVGIFGPALGPALSASLGIIQGLLTGAMPAIPNLSFNVVDVRDVADLHLMAMTSPEAAGERFLAAAGDCVALADVGQVLRDRLGAAASAVPRRRLPDAAVRLAALFSARSRQLLPQLGVVRHVSTEKARSVLGWTPRSTEDTIAVSGESLVRLGVLRDVA